MFQDLLCKYLRFGGCKIRFFPAAFNSPNISGMPGNTLFWLQPCNGKIFTVHLDRFLCLLFRKIIIFLEAVF